jgi:hypothetical protein
MALFGPSFEKVLREGAAEPAQIVGIRRFTRSDDESTIQLEEYAVGTASGLVGVRQRLEPREEVRLGMPVELVRLGKASVIRWGQPTEYRWAPVNPPGLGVDDPIDGPPAGWPRGFADIVSIGSRAGMLGLTSVTTASVRFSDESGVVDAVVDTFSPPFYATHLGAEGTRLPAARHPRDATRVRIDWPDAVLRDPGVGVGPHVPVAAGGTGVGLLDQLQQKSREFTARVAGADLSAGPGDGDPVSWETYLAVSVAIKNAGWGTPETQDAIAQQHGVAPGEWPAAHSRWQGRMMTDWRLGAAYGQAMS